MVCLSHITRCLTYPDSRWPPGTASFWQLSRETRSSTLKPPGPSSEPWERKRSQMSTTRALRRDTHKTAQFACRLPKRLTLVHEAGIALLLASLLMIVPACNQKMAIQPKYVPLRESEFFPNGMSARPLPDNSVPRGSLEDDPAFYTGKKPAGSPAAGLGVPAPGTRAAAAPGGEPGTSAAQAANLAANVLPRSAGEQDIDYFPLTVTAEVLDRGQQRFNVFCAPCHSRLGDGQGMIVKRGFRAPPSFHIDRLRPAPVGPFFDVITNGFGAMPDYAQQVSPRDRWAIIAYIRALQLSQNATLADVPPDKRAELDAGGGSNGK